MPDRCHLHDQCFDKVTDTLGLIRDELRKNHDDVLATLHEVALIHTQHEMRLAAAEAEVKELKQTCGGVNWKKLFAEMLAGLVEKGIIVVLTMAWWAQMNGYGK